MDVAFCVSLVSLHKQESGPCPYRRYQYLSFVSFLSKGVYMAPWAHGDVRSLAVEREWDGWDDFFKSGSLMLASVSL